MYVGYDANWMLVRVEAFAEPLEAIYYAGLWATSSWFLLFLPRRTRFLISSRKRVGSEPYLASYASMISGQLVRSATERWREY